MSPESFFALSDCLADRLQGGEVLFCTLDGENSDFVRLNHGRVRQGGHVRVASLGLCLIDGARQAEAFCDLGGDADNDLAHTEQLLEQLRERLAHVPDDPFLHYSTEPWSREHLLKAQMPSAERAVEQVLDLSEGLDLVGIWASGELFTALASSLGHRCWHASSSFNLDWSCFLEGDKALKDNYSGQRWDEALLGQRIARMREELPVLARAPRVLEPGRYRACLSPAALGELLELLAWDAFDLKSQRTCQTPLLQMLEGTRRFDPRVRLSEDSGHSLLADFTAEGFRIPSRVELLAEGMLADSLVDARSAKEYGASVNAASGAAQALDLAPGDLDEAQLLAQLGTGLYIGRLWYCNWSDPNECRLTGMTRFGTYWVENGERVAPVAAMRFDDSLYHLLGDRLEGLTEQREWLLSAETYDGRSSASMRLPAILVSGIELAL